MLNNTLADLRKHNWIRLALIISGAAFFAIVLVYLLDSKPATVIIGLLWSFSIFTIVLPARLQLFVLWSILPFIDMFKRAVFIDPSANDLLSYLVLFTPDVLILTIIFKLLLGTRNRTLRIHLARIDMAVLAFGIYSTLSATLISNTSLSTMAAAVGMRVWPMIAFFLYAKYMYRPKDLHILAKLSLVLALIVALYGLRQFFFGPFLFEQAWSSGAVYSTNLRHLEYDFTVGVFRTYGTLDSHSSYGVFLSLGLISAWVLRRKLGIGLTTLMSVIIFAGLIVSFTRFTWSIPFWTAGFMVLFLLGRIKPLIDLRKFRKAFLLLMVVVGAYFVLYVAMDLLYGLRLVSSSNPYLLRAFGTGTLEARLQVGNLLTGGGISLTGNGLANASYFARKFGVETAGLNYHNIFIDMISDMGLVGLIIFLWFLYELFRSGVKAIRSNQDRKTKPVLVAFFCLLLAWLLVGHFNGAVFYFGHAIPFYFWGLCGILSHYRENNDKAETAIERNRLDAQNE